MSVCFGLQGIIISCWVTVKKGVKALIYTVGSAVKQMFELTL